MPVRWCSLGLHSSEWRQRGQALASGFMEQTGAGCCLEGGVMAKSQVNTLLALQLLQFYVVSKERKPWIPQCLQGQGRTNLLVVVPDTSSCSSALALLSSMWLEPPVLPFTKCLDLTGHTPVVCAICQTPMVYTLCCSQSSELCRRANRQVQKIPRIQRLWRSLQHASSYAISVLIRWSPWLGFKLF